MRAFAQIDEFKLIRFADLFEQDVDADRADAGGIKELHLGFLAWLREGCRQDKFSMTRAIGEGGCRSSFASGFRANIDSVTSA